MIIRLFMHRVSLGGVLTIVKFMFIYRSIGSREVLSGSRDIWQSFEETGAIRNTDIAHFQITSVLQSTSII